MFEERVKRCAPGGVFDAPTSHWEVRPAEGPMEHGRIIMSLNGGRDGVFNRCFKVNYGILFKFSTIHFEDMHPIIPFVHRGMR